MNILWIIFWSVVNHVYVCTRVSECICPSSPIGHVARLTDFLYEERVVSAQCYTRGSCETSANGIMSVFCLPKILSILMVEMSTNRYSVSIKPFSEHFLISNLFNAFSVHIEGQFSSVQLLSCVRLLATPWTAVHQASLSITNSRSLLKLMSIESVMPSNHLILCCPLLLLPSIFSSIRDFSNELVLLIRWPKYWSFSFIISPSNEHSGLIFFRIDWLDLLAGILKVGVSINI